MTNRYKYEVILLATSLAEAERKMRIIEIGVPGLVRCKTHVMDRIGDISGDETEGWFSTLSEKEIKLIRFLREQKGLNKILDYLYEDLSRIDTLSEFLKPKS